MTFTDPLFLCCLLVAVLLYYLLPLFVRPYLLLALSVAFYLTWGVEQLYFILAAAAIGWVWGLLLQALVPAGDKKARITGGRKAGRILLLLLGILLLVGMWVYAKYGEEILTLMKDASFSLNLRLIVPLGISYYTLSVIGYMADVYLRKIEAEKNPIAFLMFIFYFPKILQGPIDNYRDLGPQLKVGHRADYKGFCFGAQLLLFGLFKKIVIADRLSVFLGNIFADSSKVSGSILVLALLLRPLELYCDFSGCMDMAEGISELFGIHMAENFKRPFFSRTVPEFWRRWHITLGNWFKNYVYMPLAVSKFMIKLANWFRKTLGKRAGRIISVVIPLFVVWVLTGLWHGTGVSYLIWGLYWGVLIILSTIFAPEFTKLRKRMKWEEKGGAYHALQIIRTYLLFAVGRWITLESGLEVLDRIRDFKEFQIGDLFNYSSLFQFGLSEKQFRVMVLSLVMLFVFSLLQERGSVRERVAAFALPVRWVLYLGFIFFVIIFGYYGPGYDAASFIYMQF